MNNYDDMRHLEACSQPVHMMVQQCDDPRWLRLNDEDTTKIVPFYCRCFRLEGKTPTVKKYNYGGVVVIKQCNQI